MVTCSMPFSFPEDPRFSVEAVGDRRETVRFLCADINPLLYFVMGHALMRHHDGHGHSNLQSTTLG